MATVLSGTTARATGYLVSEAEGYRSREVGVIKAAGADLPAYVSGTVLGRVTATGMLKPLDTAGADGTQHAAAILYDNIPPILASKERSVTISARDCEVNGLLLTWPSGITVDQQNAAIVELAALGIIVRT